MKIKPSFNTIVKIAGILEKEFEEKLKLKEKVSFLENLSTSDLLWDRVKTIEKIKPKDEYVYDIEVENTCNFVANGIIAHNTSLLGALLVEIMRRYRLITVEDTMELPVDYLRGIGYNVLPMKVRSAILGEKAELSAEEGIRTSLRLGDSALIMGEVRSTEALALYESMRVGALANVVAGTIHGDSPYGVFDRVVNDLKVPRTSFKATDIIIIAGKIRSPAQMEEIRRTTYITEVRKNWEDDPAAERGFMDLMKYNPEKDRIEPTRELVEGESEIVKSIASNVREWVGKWDRVWDNIQLRSKAKQMLVDYARKTNRITGQKGLLEADFIVEANDMFHRTFEKLRKETGYPDSKEVLSDYERWLKVRIKSDK